MSLTIIDKTEFRNRPAILEHVPKPTFRTSLEKQKYWVAQKQKWTEGIRIGDTWIPGTLYRHIQEHHIKNRKTGKIERPKCREVDVLTHQKYADIKQKGRVGLVVKTRGMGLTTDGAGLAEYFMAMNPGSTMLMTSKDQGGILPFFRDKYMIAFDRMDDDLRGEQVNINATKTNCYHTVRYNYITDDGRVDVAESQLYCRETSEKPSSPNNFSGFGALYGFFDEFPLHKRRDALLDSAMECFMDTSTKKMYDSLVLCGGTVESTIDNEGLLAIQELWSNVGQWDMEPIFIPFYMTQHLDNGIFINEKRAYEEWEKEYEARKSNPLRLRSFIKNNPRTVEDVFDLAASGRWEDDVAEMIKEQRKWVVQNKIQHFVGKLVETGEEVIFNNNPQGTVTIIEHPKAGVEYFLAVDGVATGIESSGEDGSDVAGVIVKMADPMAAIPSFAPVCLYRERPKSVETSYYSLINQMKYYNRYGGFKKISAEANAGTADHFATFLKNLGLIKYAERRKDLSGKGYSNQKVWFQYRNTPTKDWQIKHAHLFLRKHIKAMQLLPLLDDMLTPKLKNADALDAWLAWFFSVPDVDKPQKRGRTVSYTVPERYRDSEGRVKTKWVQRVVLIEEN